MKPRDRSLGSTRTVSLLVTLVVVSLVLILISQSPSFSRCRMACAASSRQSSPA